MNIGQILELHLGWAADRLGFRAITPVFDGVKEQEIQAELGRAWMMDWAWKLTTERAWEDHERLAASAGIAPEDFDDDMHVICAYLVERVSESGRTTNQAIIFERDENMSGVSRSLRCWANSAMTQRRLWYTTIVRSR